MTLHVCIWLTCVEPRKNSVAAIFIIHKQSFFKWYYGEIIDFTFLDINLYFWRYLQWKKKLILGNEHGRGRCDQLNLESFSWPNKLKCDLSPKMRMTQCWLSDSYKQNRKKIYNIHSYTHTGINNGYMILLHVHGSLQYCSVVYKTCNLYVKYTYHKSKFYKDLIFNENCTALDSLTCLSA